MTGRYRRKLSSPSRYIRCAKGIGYANSFYHILQVTPSNAGDSCLSVYIFSVGAFNSTVKLLFLLSPVWLTETATTLLITKVKAYCVRMHGKANVRQIGT